MLITRPSSATNMRRQVARKRFFEMNMPAKGTNAIEHKFDNAAYVRTVFQASSISDGVYVKGSINGTSITFTADTCASCTIISSRIFESVQRN